MRKARVSGQLLGVQGMVIGDVTIEADRDCDGEILVVAVRPDARSAGRCGTCRRRCPGYDSGAGTRRWRTVDTGTTRTFLEAAAPRVRCPEHGVLVAHVPWARPGAKCSVNVPACWSKSAMFKPMASPVRAPIPRRPTSRPQDGRGNSVPGR